MRKQLWMRLIVATLAISAPALTASAQPPWQRGRQDDDRSWRNSNRDVYDRGYREGVRRGEDDARRNREFNIERDGVYRDADRGYNRNYGSRDAYRDQFRRGFAEGYRVGYTQIRGVSRAPYERGDRIGRRAQGGYQEPAFARGYSDGYEKGRNDGDNGHRYDPARHGDYRGADNGYHGEYGSKDAYRNNYRSGFRQGYEDGYRAFNRGRRY
jgi:flagellar biosynthesis/type III secretory pathway protein FliH